MNRYMFKCIAIASLFFISNVNAQVENKITIMSKITCECIDNISDEVWDNDPKEEIDDCFKAAVLGGLLSMTTTDSAKKTDSIVVELGKNEVKNGDSVINNIDGDDLELTRQELRKDCERYKAFENKGIKDNSDKIVAVGYDACECIGKIDLKLDYEDKSKEIKDCIESANTSHQLLNKLTVVSDAIGDNKIETTKNLVNVAKKEVNITINTNEDYKEIENYLLETCGDMESLYFSDNQETSRKSISKKEEARKEYDLGIEAGEAQDYEKALKHYKKAVAIDRKFAFAWDNLGITYRRLNRNKEAVEAYKKSLKLDPKGKMPLMNIGVAYEKLGQYDNAIKYYNKYKKLYKNDPEAPYGLGRMYFEKKQYMPAVDNMMQAYRLYIKIDSPYKQDAEANLGVMYRALKEEGKLNIFKAAAKKNKIEL